MARDLRGLRHASTHFPAMKSFLQLLSRIGRVITAANVGNLLEFERLMTARREEELAGARKRVRESMV